MTDQEKQSLLRHLAEKVMGGEIVDNGTAVRFTLPSRDGWERAATIRINSPGGFDPLNDANAALDVAAAMKHDEGMTVNYSPWLEPNRRWDVAFIDEDFVKGSTFCEAICLAAAKATGWEEKDEREN